MFETLKPLPPDAILGIMTLFRADPHPGKIDLSVGVYQDEQGRTPVLASVKRAEKAILEKQDIEDLRRDRRQRRLQSRRRGAPLRQGPSGAEGRPRLDRADARRQRRLEHRRASRRAREAGRAHLRQRSDVAEPSAAAEGLGPAARHLSVLRLREASRRLRADVGAAREGECRRARADSRLLPQPVRRGPLEGAVASARRSSASGAASCRSSTSRTRASPKASTRTRTACGSWPSGCPRSSS